MSSSTIIFINGFKVPTWLAKSPFVWNDKLWKGYDRVYLSSKTPSSDAMVEKEIARLSNFVSRFEHPVVMGQSLGAWWAAQLGCYPQFTGKQLVFFTPLLSLEDYPLVFNASARYHPTNRTPNQHNKGYDRVFTAVGDQDLIVPSWTHGNTLAHHFESSLYTLRGGHFYQNNHKKCLLTIKNWLDHHLQ